MRHIRIVNKSVPLAGTSRHKGPVSLPNKHGIVAKHMKGKGSVMQLMEPELSEHGLDDIYAGMLGHGTGCGIKKKKHIKPLHFRI